MGIGEMTDRTRHDVDEFLDGWRVEKEIPGLSVAITDVDDLLYATGLGARDVEARAPAGPDTRYPYASVTKVVTAMVFLQFVERGDIGLEDPIRNYVDDWSDVPGDPITVRELLTHSTGVPDVESGPRNYLFSEDPPASQLVTREDKRRHLDGVAEQRIVDEDRFMYSDTNYTLLGEIVAAVDDRSFARIVEEDLFDPLGMDRSAIGYGSLAELEDTTRGYVIDDGVPSPTPFDLQADAAGLGPASPAGLLASVTDVARLVRCLLNDGELEGVRVLSEELVEAMCSHQGPKLDHVDGTPRGIGYGPRITEFLGEQLVEYSGTAPGVGRAYLGLLPDRGLGVTLGVNTPGVPVGALGLGVLALVTGEDPVAVVPYLSVREKVRAVAGSYESHHGTTVVRVEPGDNEAYVEATNESGAGWSFPAFPVSMAHDDYTFETVWPAGLRRTLEFQDTGERMELRLGSNRLRRTNR